MFLAANRRTGKTSFLQADLKPVMEQIGSLVIYVDLWADTKTDPAILVSNAIALAIKEHLGAISKLAIKTGLTSVSVAGALKLDLTKIGSTNGITLSDALKTLLDIAKKPITLIIDEAQHALTTDNGLSMMKALKSARDTLNVNNKIDLMLVMTGSDRDKLLRLVTLSTSAFYGSNVQKLPTLGIDFIDYVASEIEKAHPRTAPIDRQSLHASFVLFGEKPQFFEQAIRDSLGAFAPAGKFENELNRHAQNKRTAEFDQFASTYIALDRIDQITLWRVLSAGADLKPYDAQSLEFYKSKMGKSVPASKIQASIERLRNRDDSIILKSSNGEYSVAETAMKDWYTSLVEANHWPPASQL